MLTRQIYINSDRMTREQADWLAGGDPAYVVRKRRNSDDWGVWDSKSEDWVFVHYLYMPVWPDKEFDARGNLWLHGSCAKPNPFGE